MKLDVYVVFNGDNDRFICIYIVNSIIPARDKKNRNASFTDDNTVKHSQTCIKRPPLGQRKDSLLRQVTS
jgi:hypothetical protein